MAVVVVIFDAIENAIWFGLSADIEETLTLFPLLS